MPDTSVAIKITGQDQLSGTLKTLASNTKNFDKNLDDMQAHLDKLTGKKYELQIEANRAKQELKEAEKAFKQNADSAEAMQRVLVKGEAYDRAKNNLKAVTKEADDLAKSMRDASSEASKLENRAGEGGGLGGTLRMMGGVMGALQIGSQVKDLVGAGAQTFISSSFGDMAGDAVNSVLGNAVSSAVTGGLIAGPAGAAIGAAAGAAIGGITAGMNYFGKRDEAFKEYTQDLIEGLEEDRQARLNAGLDVAATREKDLIGLTTIAGSAELAKEIQDAMIEFGRTPPFSYGFGMSASRRMIAGGDSWEEVQNKLNALADAAAALGMDEGSVTTLYSQLESMEATGKVSSMVFRSLAKQGINGYAALGIDQNASSDAVDAILKNMDAKEIVEKIYTYMGEAFAGAASGLEDTYGGLLGISESYDEDRNAARAAGYEEVRKQGLQERIGMYEEDGRALLSNLEEADRLIGEGQAALDNLQEKMQDQAVAIVMGASAVGTEFENSDLLPRLQELQTEYNELYALAEQGDEKAKIQLKTTIEEAMAIAANEFNASELEQSFINADLTLARNVKDDSRLHNAFYDAGYRHGQVYSLGLASTVRAGNTAAFTARAMAMNDEIGEYFGGGHAFGLSYVPRNNFPTLLHQGERVLTASENRRYQNGGGNITITNTAPITVREEADIDRIASALVRKLQMAQKAAM